MQNTWLTLMKVKHCLAFLFLIISFQMVEALLEEAQQDITPEVGSEVILVDEAGETPGTPWSFSCMTSTSPSQIRFVLSYALVWRSC